MNRPAKRYFEFGSFRIDAHERCLFRNSEPVALSPKVFDLLLLLVENNGHTLAKTDLLETIWPETYVGENNLNRNISILRKTLDDPAVTDSYIKTVPKRGYRFEADVHVVVEDEDELIVEKRTNYSVTLREELQRPGGRSSFVSVRPGMVIVGLIVLAMLVLGGAITLSRSGTSNNNGVDPEALALYQRGRELWQNRSASGLHEATLLLEQAVEMDSNFALAHAALADAYAFDSGNWKQAEDVARRAIKLDGRLGEPYASIGFVKFFWEWNPAEAEIHYKKAIALSPDYPTAHQWYAISLVAVGQFNEALSEMEKALELEPGSAAINADMCQILYFLRRYDEAERQCNKAIDLDSNSFNAHTYLYFVYTAQGKYREAVERFIVRERLAANAGSIPSDFEELTTAFETGGIEEYWRTQIRLRMRANPPAYTVAWYHAQLGNTEEALEWLQTSCEKGEFYFVMFFAEPVFRKFIDDPRYMELADKFTGSKLKKN